MKKASPRRLALHRDTVKAMVVELGIDQLRHVDGGAKSSGSGTSIISTGPTFECPTHGACTVG
jgi:hypothetical protein